MNKLTEIAINAGATKSTGKLDVESTAFSNGQTIPEDFSAYGKNRSPQTQWSGEPGNVQSYVIILEDPDAPSEKPFVHWLIANIPPSINELGEGLEKTGRLPAIDAIQGKNDKGEIGYFGPRPPQGDRPHHYHFQVFALETRTPLDPGFSKEELLEAMQGHVLAKGELVGLFAKE